MAHMPPKSLCLKCNISMPFISLPVGTYIKLWEGFRHTHSPPVAVAAYNSHNQNLCMKLSVLGAIQMFVSHHLCRNPACKLPWPGEEYHLDKIYSLQACGILGWMAAQGWHSPGVCVVQSPWTTLGTTLPQQTPYLNCPIYLSEEILIPGTEDSILKMGFCTQEHQHQSLVFPFSSLPFFLLFFPYNPQVFAPSAHLMSMVGCSHRLLMRICGKRGPLSFRSACVGRGLSSTGCSQGNCVAPGLPLGHRWEVKLSSCCFYFSQA